MRKYIFPSYIYLSLGSVKINRFLPVPAKLNSRTWEKYVEPNRVVEVIILNYYLSKDNENNKNNVEKRCL